MQRGRRATIFDVARDAGVSIKTVSRVFNEAPNVRAVTRERVLTVAKHLRYYPNVVAQGLVGRRSYLLGLFYENPSPNYVFELQAGALDRLRHERYRLVVLPVEIASAVADNIVSIVHSAALDGIILTPPASDNRLILEHLTAIGFPFVRIAGTILPELGPRTTTDDFAGARMLTEHLIGLGHRRIAMIEGDPTHAASGERTSGYRKALRAASIPVEDSLTEPGGFNFESGVVAATRLLTRLERPTAIFAQNDDMAAGAIAAAHDLGLAIPTDISIVGFDDSAIAQIVYPRLTTIRQPVRDMARSAVDMLMAMLESRPHADVEDHAVRLIVRDSAAPCPH